MQLPYTKTGKENLLYFAYAFKCQNQWLYMVLKVLMNKTDFKCSQNILLYTVYVMYIASRQVKRTLQASHLICNIQQLNPESYTNIHSSSEDSKVKDYIYLVHPCAHILVGLAQCDLSAQRPNCKTSTIKKRKRIKTLLATQSWGKK